MGSRFQLEVQGTGEISVLKTAATSTPRLLFVYAPGAGSNLNDPFGAYCASRLPKEGIECWRLQFPYMEAGRRSPDRTPILEATWHAVIREASTANQPLVVGGRSMGGRIASQVVAQGAVVSGLALFAYPLHPPGKPEQRRVDHLATIDVPTLFCSGTRDAFASPEELAETAALVENSSVHLLEGADHGFATLKSNGRSREEVWAEAVDALLAFVSERLSI
jgi:predicted alpha/beta-hydrolase family hydrolase